MFDLASCHVERINDRKYLICWQTLQPVQGVSIYMSDDPESFYVDADPGLPLLSTTAREVLVANPDPGVRHFFYLEAEKGNGVVLAERKLPLEGAPNFRDIGGYEAADGRRLKWGKLYRSGKLSALTESDQQRVHRLGLTLICDFRQVMEQELEPTVIGHTSAHQIASLPVTPGSRESFMEQLHRGIIAVDDAAVFMQEINRDFVANQMPRYAEMFQLLLAGDQPVLIHCASGKDRTGVGAALILDVLGVDEEAIVEDYLLTNRYLPVEQEVERLAREFTDEKGRPVSEDVLRPLIEVRPEYIRACFDEIRRRFDSKQHFYESTLMLDEEHLRALRNRFLD